MARPRPFPYAERAERFRTAQQALNDACRHPLFAGRAAALDAFWSALEGALPEGFDQAYQQVKAGDPAGAELLIEFLEADPRFFRSGYLKADAVQYLKRVGLTETQRERLRKVVVKVVASRDGRELRRYCHLATVLDAPAFRDELQRLAASSDAGARRRASWVLAALS